MIASRSYWAACISFVALLCACSADQPRDAVEDFQQLIAQGEVDQAFEMLSGPVTTVIPPAKLRAGLANGTKQISEKGGIASVEILSEDVQGNTATVKIETTYGNGTKDEEDVQLTKIDGKWLITPDMKK